MNRTKKIILFLLMSVWLLIFSISQGFAQDRTAESRESGGSPVTVAYCIDCVPFHFQDEQGIPSGLIIDLWNLWSEKTGQRVEFTPHTWEESLKKVGSGEADVHAGLFFNEQRDKFLDYGQALTGCSTHVFLHRTMPEISKLAEVAAYRIGVLKGDYVEGFLKEKLPPETIVAYPSYHGIIAALKSGELRAFAVDTLTGIYHLQKANLLGEYSVKPAQLLYTNDWFVAVTEGKQPLLERINKGFDLISEEERRQIARRWGSKGDEKALIIAIDRDYPPLTKMTSFGEPAGLLVDFWRAWAKKTGHEIRFRMSDWAGTVKAMRQGEADIHSGLFLNKERQEFLDFTQPIYQINTSFYYRRSATLPEDPAQFGYRRVAILAGSHQESALRQDYPDLKVISFPSWQTVLEALKSGKVDAAIGEDLTMAVLLDDLGWGSKITKAPTPLFSNVVYGAVAKGNEQLLAKINGGLKSLTPEEKAAMERLWLKHPEHRTFDSTVPHDSGRLQLSMEERAWLETHPDLRLGVDPSWPPYDFVDSHGKHQGLAADILASLRKTLGIGMKLSGDLTWSQVLDGAKKRTVDIVSLLTPTPERAEYLLFSNPIVSSPWVIATRTDYKSRKGMESLYGKKVVVAEGYAVISLLRAKHADLPFTEVSTPLEALKKVSLGEADAYIGNFGSIVHLIREEGLFNIHITGPTGFPPAELSIGVRSDQPELLALINKGLEAITKEKMRAMVDRWVPMDSIVTSSSKVMLSEQEQAWLVQHPEITIAFEGNFAPYSEYISGGGFSGYAVDVVNLISQRTGIQFKIHPDGEWQTLFESAKKKALDVVAEMVPREERKEWFAFTDPYIYLSSYIFTKTNDTRVNSRSDVSGMRVAVIEDYSLTDYVLAAHPDITPVYVKNSFEALNSVQEGRADLFIGAEGVANHLINIHGMANLRAASLWQQNVSNKSFGVRKDWPELVNILSKGLASISEQEWSTLRNKWVSMET
ncbi:MAG: transporter substrate-binding domain-containing protein, partial [Sedimenticola sp.]